MTPAVFNRNALLPGMIFGRYTVGSPISQAIVLRTAGIVALARGTSWSHDAMLIAHNHRWYLGDAEMGKKARLTPLEEWEERAACGDIRCTVLWPTGCTQEQGEAAAWRWQCEVYGSTYDRIAIRDMAWRYLAERFGNKLGRDDHFYCTEGCQHAYRTGAGFDPWAPKLSPTPGTTSKRTRQGAFQVAEGAFTEYGRQFSIRT